MDKEIKVGIADMKVARVQGLLITYALGSCIGVTLYDPVIKLGGLLHIMLPSAENVWEMLRKMQAFGGMKVRYVCKIAGGAKMFEMQGSLGNIGQRNIQSVQNVLRQEGIRIVRQDVGANYARTLSMDVETGTVKVRSYGRPEIIL